jgi:Uncharacterised ACR, YkgG family COG1556.
MESKVSKTIESLKKNGMEGKYFETSKEAVEYILSQVPGEASVGIGGSMTVNSIGIVDKLKERGNTVFFHWLVKDKAESTKARRQAFGADVYMCSSNALTMDGKLINIDATGNRVAGMFYGPPKVYVICGVNKIAEDVDRGFERIRENAYKNAERLKLNTPCVKTKHCTDCSAPDRMCNVKVIIDRKPSLTDIEVIIINEELGF